MNWEKLTSKDHEYMLFKHNTNSSYKLITCKPIAGGLDIIHYLTQKEIQDYQDFGIESLKSRMVDMDKNFSKYEVISWR
ncbi:hypothetical protein [Tenacibaculum jejuense]|uniref:Uncharacterized protein n=1 Tax=Tenacibaculum jejuense TaxID=584609 RepID=A0A238U529_9FLAO|nr:hypothetical protein [Tenacibaculum jejuense]SNR14145.1 protein of unknown function [Tenacibaculum jejuense]